jgi:hypothetical protein
MNTIIYQTTNYKQFKFLKENREIHPRYLVESISKKNLLAEHPIICDQNLNVIDGQHRLKAAEFLNTPIFYIISENAKPEDISLCQVQKAWTLHDFLNFYSNKQDYQFISELMFAYKLPIHFAITCCTSDKKAYEFFRRGTFNIKKNKEEIREHVKNTTEITAFLYNLCLSTGTESGFLQSKARRAIWGMTNEKDYDHNRMMHALKQYPGNALCCLTINSETLIKQALKQRVYNFKREKKNRLK